MLRKLLFIVPIAVLGLFAACGMAAAAPGDPYPPEAPAGVFVPGLTPDENGRIIVQAGVSFDFSGSGFTPFEGIDGTISGPIANGLRHSAVSVAASVSSFVATADSKGSFSYPVVLEQAGTYTLTAVGRSSGLSDSLTITVGTPTAPATTTVAGAGSGSSNGSGLAYTGTSIAGPLAVGMVALLGGLTLLFFGTRAVRIRRRAQTH